MRGGSDGGGGGIERTITGSMVSTATGRDDVERSALAVEVLAIDVLRALAAAVPFVSGGMEMVKDHLVLLKSSKPSFPLAYHRTTISLEKLWLLLGLKSQMRTQMKK